ncbi:MAG: hypothetical protein CVV22_07850 [Ignavibacteriae bacterium HGW-Ignavibacteriae-1]|jgi:hypothetical protein|nr:MAG: hypothetical protein CVV22_07850 [Ignavibacteriae bacterium HGW-Ignavibacteriae-1]
MGVIMKLLLRLGKIRNAFLLSMVIGFIALTITDSYSQSNRPEIPKLSLMGQDESYDTDFYPDGRIWVPPTTTGAREFLVPVFITNNWASYENAQGVALYSVNPITSFEFSIFYNGQAVRAIGVEKAHPAFIEDDLDYEPLASTFEFKTDDFEDDYYWYYLNPNKWADARDNEAGRRIVIAGASAKNLPNTDRLFKEYKVLLYVRFRVIATSQPGDPSFQLLQTSPMYIDNRKVNYNDMDVARDFAWQHMTDYDINNYRNLYNRVLIGPNRGRLDGNLFVPESYLDGMNNAPISEDDNNIILPGPLQDDAMWKTEPVLPGVITLKISDAVPRFRVASVTDDEYESFDNGSLYHLPQVVTVDDNSPEVFGIARIKITNSTTKSRLSNIRIETDNDWLRISRDILNENNTFRTTARDGSAKWLDNGILGTELDPILKSTQDDGDIFIRIDADPTKLTNKGEEPWGLHEGFITIHSDYAIVSPVRVRVLFYFLANPFEPSLTKTTPGGINLKVTNSAGATGQSLNMVFGTGHRATDGIDLLYGERAYTFPLAADRFDVRFYPFPDNAAIPYGFADFAPNVNGPRSISRDIRNHDMPSDINSYIYLARFNNAAQDYPIIVEWDTQDFPDGAQLFIRSVLQGELSPATDMRLATPTGATTRAFTIQDPRVKEFRIEYTLPSTIRFVDSEGFPVIKFGWNMLSMPLKPTNSKWDVVYKNAINIPYAFTNTQYQPREILKFGEGYFVKYPQTVDTTFAGAFITEVGVPNDYIRVYGGDAPDPGDPQYRGGWNLIGALSVETSVEGILFTPLPDGSLPNTEYTKRYDVWGYKTDLGYHAVSVLTPGMGYWIKTSGDGYLRLIYTPKNPFKNSVSSPQETKQNILDKSQMISVRDNAQKHTQLYISNNSNLEIDNFELPPTPPLGLFDVRFNENKYLTNATENVITLQGATYPVSFTVNNAETNLTFIDPVTGEVYGTIEAGKSGSVQIRNLPFNSVKIMKPTSNNVSSFAFSTYPNPATHNATMTIELPENGIVVVGLYDALGNQVATLLNEEVAAGQFIHNVDLSAYASGSYTLKVVAGQFSTAAKLNIVK